MVADASLFDRTLDALRDLSGEGNLRYRFQTGYGHWQGITDRDMRTPELKALYKTIRESAGALDQMTHDDIQKLITHYAGLCVYVIDSLCD